MLGYFKLGIVEVLNFRSPTKNGVNMKNIYYVPISKVDEAVEFGL